MTIRREQNIVLIGMPGVGKSTVGVLLAKATGRNFVDTDVLIQVGQDRTLQDILDRDGRDAFLRIEEDYLACLECRASVIATGGSAVYSARAMEHLRSLGPVVYLHLGLDELRRRLDNLHIRGVVMDHGQTLAELHAERLPLYRHWAGATIDCQGLTQDEVVARIIAAL